MSKVLPECKAVLAGTYPVPNHPIQLASLDNLTCNGVGSLSVRSEDMILPYVEFLPTLVTKYVPSPSRTLLPEMMKGSISSVAVS